MNVHFEIKNYGSGPAFLGFLSFSGFVGLVDAASVDQASKETFQPSLFPKSEDIDLRIVPYEKQVYQISYTKLQSGANLGFSKPIGAPIHIDSRDSKENLVIILRDVRTPSPQDDLVALKSCMLYRPYIIGEVEYSDVYGRIFQTRLMAEGNSTGEMLPYGGPAFNFRT